MVKILPEKFPKGYGGFRTKSDGFYMDQHLYDNYTLAKKAIREDWDMFTVIDGQEGTGKSVLAQQLAMFVDPTFCIERVCFRAEEFKEAVLKAKKYESIVFDEAYGGLSSRRAMSSTNHMLVDMMAEIRQKNLFVFIVLPSFFELDKYVAIHRSRILIHVYQKNFVRGFFEIFSGKKKKLMYLMGKKTYNYRCVKSSFRGRFANFYPVDKNLYVKKKLESLRSMDSEKEKEKGKPQRVRNLERMLYFSLKDRTAKEREDISIDCGLKTTTLKNFCYRYKVQLQAEIDIENQEKMKMMVLPDDGI